jgi:hypothetical protein
MITSHSVPMENILPPLVSLFIPPALREEAEKVAAQSPSVHPAWAKIGVRGRHFIIRTSSIEDLEELADWAQSWLVEPEVPLDKAKRQAFQNVLERASRHVHLQAIGKGHMLATGWKAHKQH